MLAAIEREPRVTLHVRRGDYLDPKTRRHHGLAEPDYFERAQHLLRDLGAWNGGRIFSDSPEAAAAELARIPDLEIVRDPEALGEPTTLRAMASGSGFIMSNSSFSWWSAWMMQRRSPARIVAPRPWVASGGSAHELLDPSWITLGAAS